MLTHLAEECVLVFSTGSLSFRIQWLHKITEHSFSSQRSIVDLRISQDEQIIFEDEKTISEDEQTISEDEQTISEAKQTISEGGSKPTGNYISSFSLWGIKIQTHTHINVEMHLI